jgi:hypothetical protein
MAAAAAAGRLVLVLMWSLDNCSLGGLCFLVEEEREGL